MYLSSISLWLLQRVTLVAVSISLFEILMFPQSIFFPQELWANFILCCIICCIYWARFITYLLCWANFRQSCCVKFKFKSLWAQHRKVEFFAKICYNLSETKVFINWRNCWCFLRHINNDLAFNIMSYLLNYLRKIILFCVSLNLIFSVYLRDERDLWSDVFVSDERYHGSDPVLVSSHLYFVIPKSGELHLIIFIK